jgi:hypothetical protein
MPQPNFLYTRASGRLRAVGDASTQFAQEWMAGVASPVAEYLSTAAGVLDGTAKVGDLARTGLALWVETAHLMCTTTQAVFGGYLGGSPGTGPDVEAADPVLLDSVAPADLPGLEAPTLVHDDGKFEIPRQCITFLEDRGKVYVSLNTCGWFPIKNGVYRSSVSLSGTRIGELVVTHVPCLYTRLEYEPVNAGDGTGNGSGIDGGGPRKTTGPRKEAKAKPGAGKKRSPRTRGGRRMPTR